MEILTNSVGRRNAALTWLTQVEAFAERYLREALRDWVGLFWSFAFPVIWYLLTVHLSVMPDVASGESAGAKAILGLSFGVFGAFTVTMVGFAGHLSADLRSRRYRKFRSLPLAPSADLAGRFVAGSALGMLSFATVLAVSAADGASYGLAGPVSALVVPASVFLFCLVGMVVGLFTTLAIPNPQHATTVGTGVLIVVFLVTGYNGLAAGMFPADGDLLNVLPNSLATRLLAYHLTGVDWALAGLSPPPPPRSLDRLSILAAYGLGLSALGIGAMNRWVYRTDAGE